MFAGHGINSIKLDKIVLPAPLSTDFFTKKSHKPIDLIIDC